jgi:hypothetical protein
MIPRRMRFSSAVRGRHIRLCTTPEDISMSPALNRDPLQTHDKQTNVIGEGNGVLAIHIGTHTSLRNFCLVQRAVSQKHTLLISKVWVSSSSRSFIPSPRSSRHPYFSFHHNYNARPVPSPVHLYRARTSRLRSCCSPKSSRSRPRTCAKAERITLRKFLCKETLAVFESSCTSRFQLT